MSMHTCVRACVCVSHCKKKNWKTQKSGNAKKNGSRRGRKRRERKQEDTTTHLSAKPTSSSDSPDDGNNSTGPSCCGLAFLLLRFFNMGMLYSPSWIMKEYHTLIHILKIKHLKYTLYWRFIRTYPFYDTHHQKKRHNRGGN